MGDFRFPGRGPHPKQRRILDTVAWHWTVEFMLPANNRPTTRPGTQELPRMFAILSTLEAPGYDLSTHSRTLMRQADLPPARLNLREKPKRRTPKSPRQGWSGDLHCESSRATKRPPPKVKFRKDGGRDEIFTPADLNAAIQSLFWADCMRLPHVK